MERVGVSDRRGGGPLPVGGGGEPVQPAVGELVAPLGGLVPGFPLHGADIAVIQCLGGGDPVHGRVIGQRLVEPRPGHPCQPTPHVVIIRWRSPLPASSFSAVLHHHGCTKQGRLERHCSSIKSVNRRGVLYISLFICNVKLPTQIVLVSFLKNKSIFARVLTFLL